MNNMGQYEDRVETRRLQLQAEAWANKVKSIHNHSMDSMWYDTRPQDTENGKRVLDIEYNSGLIKREFADNDFVYLGAELKGEELLQSYSQNN